ncbi:MAG: CHRD domain-containing protein [Bauldia sp.]
MRNPSNLKTVVGLGAGLLLGASALAMAQAPAPAPAPAEPPAAAPAAPADDAPFVTEEEATQVAELTGDEEVPPVTTSATGTAWILADPQALTVRWYVTYEGLTGPATGAHFHGPAEPGENADVVIDLTGGDAAGGLDSPIEGEATLTQDQFDQLIAGDWYVNIHTEANPGGEIRGQVVAKDAEGDAAAPPAGGAAPPAGGAAPPAGGAAPPAPPAP